VKYERIHFNACESACPAREEIADLTEWFKKERPHSSLQCFTPNEQYWANLPLMKAVAQPDILGARRVAHRIGRFVANTERRSGQLCIAGEVPTVHLKVRRSFSNKGSHFLRLPGRCKVTRYLQYWIYSGWVYMNLELRVSQV